MNAQIVSVIVIVRHGNRFLLVRRDPDDDIFPGKWQNTGGKVEPGETLEAAAKRELKEETGVELRGKLDFVMSYSWEKAPDEPKRLGVILLINLPQQIKDIHITLNDELCEYGWFTIAQAKKLDTIGPDSSTGTLGQLRRSAALL